MFTGAIVWKSLLYALLMIATKGCVSSAIYFEYCGDLANYKLTHPRRRGKEGRLRNSKKVVSNMQMKSHACHTQLQAQNESAPITPPYAVALLVGFARVARGEIGFLIASLSQSSRKLTLRLSNESGNTSSNEDIFQVISWAVVLCTINGLGVDS